MSNICQINVDLFTGPVKPIRRSHRNGANEPIRIDLNRPIIQMSTKSESKQTASDDDKNNDTASSDNDFQDDDDDGGDGERRISGHGSQLQHASMTESYSEILNSPTDSNGAAFSIGEETAATSGPYPIPKRRPGSLPTAGKNCECNRWARMMNDSLMRVSLIVTAEKLLSSLLSVRVSLRIVDNTFPIDRTFLSCYCSVSTRHGEHGRWQYDAFCSR